MVLYEDYPVEELRAGAEAALNEMIESGAPDPHVYFKATCPSCGERCMFQEPDTIFEEMECGECGTLFPFTKGNYMLSSVRLPRLS